MKRIPLSVGDVCGFWTVINGPTSMLSGKLSVRRPHWWVRCQCGTERFLIDSNLRRMRDGILNDKYWSCGCVLRQCQRDVTTRYYRNAYDLQRT